VSEKSPLGIGACIGAILNGKVLDVNYRRMARKLGVSVDRKRGDDLRNFPIERTRLQPVFFFLTLEAAALLPYGWVLERRASLAAPLVLQFIAGLGLVASMNTLSTLLVDIFPDRPSTASAASNLVRCLLGAVGAAVVDYMLSGMGWGWCFFFVGLVTLSGQLLLWVEMRYGMQWRSRRWEKLEKEKRKEEMQEGTS
jgi:MFS family permease